MPIKLSWASPINLSCVNFIIRQPQTLKRNRGNLSPLPIIAILLPGARKVSLTQGQQLGRSRNEDEKESEAKGGISSYVFLLITLISEKLSNLILKHSVSRFSFLEYL